MSPLNRAVARLSPPDLSMISQQIPSREVPNRQLGNQKITNQKTTNQGFSDFLGQSPSEVPCDSNRLFCTPHPECISDRRKACSFEPRVADSNSDWTCLPSVISAECLYPSAPMDMTSTDADSADTVAAESLSVDTLEAELAALLIRFDFADGAFPSETIAAYADFSSENQKLRLYALAWTAAGAEEMSLYLVLQPMAGSYLPLGTEVSVVESDLFHSGQSLRWTSHPVYLYTQIFGAWESQFSVKVSFPNTLPITLSPLTLA